MCSSERVTKERSDAFFVRPLCSMKGLFASVSAFGINAADGYRLRMCLSALSKNKRRK